MSTFATLKSKIKTILEANSYLAATYDYEIPKLNATPAAIVVASDNESDFDSTSQNMRTYGFQVTLLVPWNPKGAEAAESTLTELVDSLLDDFDDDFTLGGSAVGGVRAAPSRWGWQRREQDYRTAEITLRCRAHYAVNPT